MIKLFIDSGCNLSKELLEKYNISVLEAGIVFKDVSYHSSVTWEYFSPEEFISSLQEGNISKVFQPAIGDWEKQLKSKITSPDEEIVYLATESKISGSPRVFNILKNIIKVPNKLHSVEGVLAGPTTELTVLEIAKNLTENSTFEDIRKQVFEINKKIKFYDISENMHTWISTGRADKSKDFIYQEGLPLIRGSAEEIFTPIGLFSSFNDALNKFAEEIKGIKINKCVINYAYKTPIEQIRAFERAIEENNNCEILANHISGPSATAVTGANSINVAFI